MWAGYERNNVAKASTPVATSKGSQIVPGPTVDVPRFVVPVAAESRLDDEGFLVDPGQERSWWSANNPALEVRKLLADGGSFVVLAPGGMGKTTVLDILRKVEADAILVDLTGLDKRGIRDRLVEALSEAETVYVDAIDT